jgi:hypothetical protein
LEGRESKMMEMMKFRLSFSTAILSLFFVSLSYAGIKTFERADNPLLPAG